MYKKRFLQFWILLLLLMIVFFAGAHAFAVEDAGSVITEERCLERDGQKIYGKLFLPEETNEPLPLVRTETALNRNLRSLYKES